jgi:hypothetical protein
MESSIVQPPSVQSDGNAEPQGQALRPNLTDFDDFARRIRLRFSKLPPKRSCQRMCGWETHILRLRESSPSASRTNFFWCW